MIAVDIVVLDYGLGNANSVVSFLRSLGCHVIVSSDARQIRCAKALFIPGVGAFAAGMEKIEALGLKPVLEEFKAAGGLVVGICLGMQLFAESSSEHGKTAGLGWIPGHVQHLTELISDKRLVPHIGWNNVDCIGIESFGHLLRSGNQFYFDHSFYFSCDAQYVLGTTEIGRAFPSIVRSANVVGFQFHPEKSQMSGKRLIATLLDEFSISRKPLCLPSV